MSVTLIKEAEFTRLPFDLFAIACWPWAQST
jgi:hypothetical protein